MTFIEELGQGAFAKVHKGILKELPKAEVFFKPREQRVEMNEGKVVAIKVVHGKQTHDKYVNNNQYQIPLPFKKSTLCNNIFYRIDYKFLEAVWFLAPLVRVDINAWHPYWFKKSDSLRKTYV